MKDVLGWDCEDGCTCVKDGHIHYNQIPMKPSKPRQWWNIF